MRKRKRFYGLMAMLTAVMMLGAGTAYADVGFDAASYQGCYNAQAAVNDGAHQTHAGQLLHEPVS